MPPVPVRGPNQRPLPPSVVSVTSISNDKGDNEMILGTVHMPYSRGKPQKTSARRQSDEGAVRPVIASNGVPFLQMRSVGSYSTSEREMEGIKERTEVYITSLVLLSMEPWAAAKKTFS